MTPATAAALVRWDGYEQSLAAAQTRSGVDESVTVAVERFGAREAVVARLHFDFLGGSMGRVHGGRIVAAIDDAVRRGIPFLAVIASGGARTQEGYDALVQMGATVAAVNRARDAGIPTIAWLRHPTMGGVHASYGAAADLIVADRGAAVGFAGPRVVTAFTGITVDGSSHTAESYHAAGLIDALADDEEAAYRILEDWISLAHPLDSPSGDVPADDLLARDVPARNDATAAVAQSDAAVTGWDAVTRARAVRPGVRDILREATDQYTELRGDRVGADDDCMVTALARVDGRRVVVIGTDRDADGAGGRRGAPAAAGFRKAQRAIRLAGRWRVPVVTLIDTAGADPSPASDRSGLAASISETLAALLDAPVPTLAIVTGEGGSGGAFALAAADRIVMQDDAVFEVIAPEGAASILLRDPARAPEIAERMGLGADDLRRRGHVDATIPGPTTHGAATALAALRAELRAHVDGTHPSSLGAAGRLRRFPTSTTEGDAS